MSTVIHGVAQQPTSKPDEIHDVNIRAHCISLSACQRNLHERRSSPVSNISSTRCSCPQHIFATKQNTHESLLKNFFFPSSAPHNRFFTILVVVTVHSNWSIRRVRGSHGTLLVHRPAGARFYLWKEKKKKARNRISRGKERCLCFSCAACASFSVPLSFSFYLYLYFYLPLYVVSRFSLSYAEQQKPTRNAKRAPEVRQREFFSWSSTRHGRRRVDERRMKRAKERETNGARVGRGGGERVRARERRRVSDVTLKCLTRL